jgi:hypothetical protein
VTAEPHQIVLRTRAADGTARKYGRVYATPEQRADAERSVAAAEAAAVARGEVVLS